MAGLASGYPPLLTVKVDVPAVPAKFSSQHIEMAVTSQPAGLLGVLSAPVTGSNSRSQGFPGGATSGCELSQQICPLLDQFVKRGRQLEADCLGGLEIDDQLDVLACNALTHQDAILCSLSDVPIAAITVHFSTGHDTAAMGGLGVAQRFL